MKRNQKYWLLCLTLSPTWLRRLTMCRMMVSTQVLVLRVEELERHFSRSPEKLVLTSLAELSTRKGLMYLSPSSEARNSNSQAEAELLRLMIE